MTIVSRPSSREYVDNWDRIFAPKPPVKWGVVVGSSVKGSGIPLCIIRANKGRFCTHKAEGIVALFDSRKEAREEAKKRASQNKYWHYHAKQYSPETDR